MSYAISSTLRECQCIYFECVPRNASEINIPKMNFQPKDGKLVRLIFPFYIQIMQILYSSTLICAAKDTLGFHLIHLVPTTSLELQCFLFTSLGVIRPLSMRMVVSHYVGNDEFLVEIFFENLSRDKALKHVWSSRIAHILAFLNTSMIRL